MWTSIKYDGPIATVNVDSPESCAWLSTIAGMPVSYLRSQENTQTLSDGTHLTNQSVIYFYYRDSAGRVRTESPLHLGGRGSARGWQVQIARIEDPVSGLQYIVDADNHMAYRFPFAPCAHPEETQAANPARAASGSPPKSPADSGAGIRRSQESLGTQMIEGVYAQGFRTTTVFPVGLFGNDRPITRTCEVWHAVENLGNNLLSQCADPRLGLSITRMTNISRAEPDPALFQVPAGYRIVDGPAEGHVTLKFERPPP